MRKARLLAACALLAAACAGPARRPSSTVQRELPFSAEARGGGGTFDVRYSVDDAAEGARLQSAILLAAATLSGWGTFEHPVDIRVYPDHESVGGSAQRDGYPW